jgi:hypothetical protein
MIKISKKLDSIANRLEMSGLKKMAMEIDTVTNTIEASQTIGPGLDKALAEQIESLSGKDKQEFDAFFKRVMDSTGGDPEKIKSELKKEFGSSSELIEEAKEIVEGDVGNSSREAFTLSITTPKILAGVALMAYLAMGSPGMKEVQETIMDKAKHTQLEIGGVGIPTNSQLEKGVAYAIAAQIVKSGKVKEALQESRSVDEAAESIKDMVDDYTSNTAVVNRLVAAPDGEKVIDNLDELSKEVAQILMDGDL